MAHEDNVFVRKIAPKKERYSESSLPMLERQWRENKAFTKSAKAIKKAEHDKFDPKLTFSNVPYEQWEEIFGYAYQFNNERFDINWNLIQVRKDGKWEKV